MTAASHPLADAIRRGLLSRREFVDRALAAGATLGSVAALLAGCRPAPRTDETAMPAELEKELRIYNWSDYIGRETIAGFQREFGVHVIYDTYESNEDLIAKLQAGATGYDLVVPSGNAVTVLRALELLVPIDRSFLTNWSNLMPQFVGSDFDPENQYTVPWLWGMTGLAVRTDKVPLPDSWGVYFEEQYRGKMTQLDDMRDVVGCWLKYRGHSLNSRDPVQLAQAKADALRAKANVKSYVSAPVKGQLITGDVWIAQLWNGDTAQAKAEQPALEFVIPREGSQVNLDSLVIPHGAPHRRAAHEFLNYILRPEVAAEISDVSGYGSPNAAALERQRRPVPPPTSEEMALLEYQEDLAEATELWDRIWTEIKAG